MLRQGSLFFRAQAERHWTGEQEAGGKLELRVPLDHADCHRHALTAIRFMYTSELASSDTAELLGVRRMASFLGVEGCVEAVDAALLAQTRTLKALRRDVHGMHQCLRLLPDSDEGPAASALRSAFRAAFRAQLAAHPGGLPRGGQLMMGEVLAWAYSDAPSVLSDPVSRKQLLALSADAIEALLSNDTFATDNEDSVLLLLAEWLDAQSRWAVLPGTRKRLCRCVRLCQLSGVYLHGMLPLLEWFPVSAAELRFICQYREATDEWHALKLRAAAQKAGFDTSSAWYSRTARPRGRSDAGVPYEWIISREKMEAGAAKLLGRKKAKGIMLDATFTSGAKSVVACGFEWAPQLCMESAASRAAGAYLFCELPAALKLTIKEGDAQALVGTASPGACTLAVFRGRGTEGGEREVAAAQEYASGHVPLGRGRGSGDALPLLPPQPLLGGAAAPAAAQAVLARWEPYLEDGKVCGCLAWAAA
ncbi:hypothetical protein HYH03_010994 [Edaphochlamys debaryana]|uniref:BACK domain-containing protein n=1 Tax=Edaphochlamys debaryana TaxID=47281 RepID=A0A836BVG0_9CHLO|nr:hypothetical protein HYH03_010994 [Edaphochlamys debaryana]|eukprot:KAG2490601.1 hypothetical protein HYH03_010994 [Edaphochlamys debaryana]